VLAPIAECREPEGLNPRVTIVCGAEFTNWNLVRECIDTLGQ
jgi:hypothetical protein